MSSKEQLNSLAVKAKTECQQSRADIYSLFIPIVLRESEKIWTRVRDCTSFEQECYKAIEYTIKTFDELKHRSFYALVKTSIYRIKSKHLKKRSCGRERLLSFEALAGLDSGDDNLGYQFKDDKAEVETEVLGIILGNEKASTLAGGDSRKLAILKSWINGLNDTEISEVLANLFGGNSTSHRVFISRFKTYCQKQLNMAA